MPSDPVGRRLSSADANKHTIRICVFIVSVLDFSLYHLSGIDLEHDKSLFVERMTCHVSHAIIVGIAVMVGMNMTMQ